MLHLYNSLTRTKELFTPIEPGKVRMYVCGITVYDYCHVGHARMFTVFDMVQRWLRASGYDLTYVRNITDIEDKIIKRSVEAGVTIRELTDRYIAAMHEDEAALGIERPDHEPRATEHVSGMLDLIGLLKTNGFAYQADDGDVNFSVRLFNGYGKLSGKSLDDLRAGERVAIEHSKRDPLDFVLWKAAKPDDPDQATWDSSFGKGRPGWHIECSAMARALLGDQIDIHGGGEDLQFPHHENEIAQSEGALFHNADQSDKRFVNYWLHNGFIRVDEQKMSKSLGNFFTVRDVLRQFDPEVIRLFILRAHYRSPLNYSDAHLEDARQALLRLYTAFGERSPPPADIPGINWASPFASRFRAAMDDDFNTPQALAALYDLATEVNKTANPDLARLFRSLAAILGLLNQSPDVVRRTGLRGPDNQVGDGLADLDDAAIGQKIVARAEAKQNKDFATADAIRDELTAMGIVLEDKAGGTGWRRA
ncbi:MAG: cysteine--tRNA ligase [Burkholderiaceae bacterium]